MAETIYKKTAEAVVQKLIEKKETIAFAESCTGGLACAKLVDVPSASAVLSASFITYSNEAKTVLLGVPENLIAAHGAVSEPVAGAMAAGAAKRAGAQIGVGISGIAGPTGALPGKPIGTVCFGFFLKGKEKTFTT